MNGKFKCNFLTDLIVFVATKVLSKANNPNYFITQKLNKLYNIKVLVLSHFMFMA